MKKILLISIFMIGCFQVGLSQQKAYNQLIGESAAKKDTAGVIRFFLEKIRVQGTDTAGFQKVADNNLIFNYLFKYSSNKSELEKAADYMLVLLKEKPKDETGRIVYATFMDTYANLIYKAGKPKKAIACEERALTFADNLLQPQLQEVLTKMKAGQPTW